MDISVSPDHRVYVGKSRTRLKVEQHEGMFTALNANYSDWSSKCRTFKENKIVRDDLK